MADKTPESKKGHSRSDKMKQLQGTDALPDNSQQMVDKKPQSKRGDSHSVKEKQGNGEGSKCKGHTFWPKQPVMQLKDARDSSLPEGLIRQQISVQKVPSTMNPKFEWENFDMSSRVDGSKICKFLGNHYVQNKEEDFRLHYSEDYLRWALCPPGFKPDWHVGVVVADHTRSLVGFVSAIPKTS
ncbi:glycylpeptide N-tetradecanoyltransferase [Orobanche minor]